MQQYRNRLAALAMVAFIATGAYYAFATNASTGTSVRRQLTSLSRYQIDDSSGTVTLVPGVASTKIQVWGVTLATAEATTMQFKSASTALTGVMSINAIQIDPPAGVAGTDSAVPWLETNTGDALILSLGSAVQVGGQVIYTQQ